MIISYFFVFPLNPKEEEEEDEEFFFCALHAAKCKDEKSEKIVSDLCTKFLFPPTKQGVCCTVALQSILKAKEEL
jgi:hypothetical protein